MGGVFVITNNISFALLLTGSPFEDLSDAASPFSSDGSLEGATGYNSSLESDQLKGATGGYGYTRGRGELKMLFTHCQTSVITFQMMVDLTL